MKNAAIREKHLSGYDLTTALIRGQLGTLELNSNAKLVLLYFATCYNAKKGVVFPKIKTVADSVGISEIGAKRAVAELVGMGYILKTKRAQNANQYVITNKILKYQDDTTQPIQDDTSENQKDTSEGITVIPPCIEVKQEEIKQTTSEVVAIPEIILKNKEILNKQAYWRSLDTKAKQYYIDKQKDIDHRKQLEEQRREEQKQYFAELEKIKEEPLFYTLLNRTEAIDYLTKLKKIDVNLSGIHAQYLLEKFNIEV